MLSRATLLKTNIEASPAYADGEKHSDVNYLASNINREREDLQGVYRVFDRLNHQINDETRQVDLPTNAELTA